MHCFADGMNRPIFQILCDYKVSNVYGYEIAL